MKIRIESIRKRTDNYTIVAFYPRVYSGIVIYISPPGRDGYRNMMINCTCNGELTMSNPSTHNRDKSLSVFDH
jgi:hypothetical protein